MKFKIGDRFKKRGEKQILSIISFEGDYGVYKNLYKFSPIGRYTEDFIEQYFIPLDKKSNNHPLTKIFQ